MKQPQKQARNLFRGFSLPEVTLAVAISGLGLTSILGLVPQSLETLKKAGNIAIESRINQHVIASVSAAEWTDTQGSDLLGTAFNSRRFYFDDVAVPLDPKNPGDQVTYVAEVEVPATDVVLSSGSSDKPAADPFLRRVKVKLANVATKDFDFNHARPGAYRTYSSLVARAGR